MINTIALIETKKGQLDKFQPLSPELVTSLNEWFKIELTYTSNAIEGNTLSRAETALVVEKGLTVDGKTLQEHQEAVNHAQAFDWIINYSNTRIDENLILNLHRLILQKIDDANAGRYRTVSVRIAGSTVIMPNPVKVPELMKEFINWLYSNQDHPLKTALDAHYKLVSIHPFVDGNGRTARLLMNLLLMQAGYPPAIVHKEDRKRYIASIEKAQLGGSLDDYYTLMYTSVEYSLDIYLQAADDKQQVQTLQRKSLLKIGELAKVMGETVPTIRYWTKEGLLHVTKYSPGGYQLYSQTEIEIVKKIRKLQEENRLTITEIKRSLGF